MNKTTVACSDTHIGQTSTPLTTNKSYAEIMKLVTNQTDQMHKE